MMPETPVLWAFEEDIRTRSWKDWLIAHTSFLNPLHRYEGVLSISPVRINLSGKDKRRGDKVSLDIYKYEIDQLYLGFDKTFSAWETRSLGLTWVPLRIIFTQNEKEEKLYLIVNYNLGFTDNKECFEFLMKWLS